MNITRFTLICAALVAIGAGAQTATEASGTMHPGQPEPDWSFSASAYAYFVPEGDDYVQPTITADRGGLHLEARYNYEDRGAGSAWVGYTVSLGEKLSLDITPMIGGVFGSFTGVAPGYRVTLDWLRLEFYTEGEFVFDTRERTDSFFYSWSELTLSPKDWLRLGLVAQHTRAYETEREIQPGFLAGFRFRHLEVTAHVFNPDIDSPTYVLSVVAEF